jgi:hypothetical protein
MYLSCESDFLDKTLYEPINEVDGSWRKKRNKMGSGRFLPPLPSTMEKSEMHRLSIEMFTKLVKKAIPPSSQPDAAKT